MKISERLTKLEASDADHRRRQQIEVDAAAFVTIIERMSVR